MDKKAKFEAFIAEKSKAAKNLIDNAITAIDQNDDGKFDLADVAVVADVMGTAAKKSAQLLKESAEEKARLYELKTLRPIFTSSLDSADFAMPKLIRVIERPQEYIDSEVCQGSIGFVSKSAGLNIVNIFYDSIDIFGLNFYPNTDCDFYYVDPCDRDSYIVLDEYFNYLKNARINELERIAQDLGAKSFRIIYKEEVASFTDAKGKGKIKSGAKVEAEHHSTEKNFSNFEVASEMVFLGHAPVEPKLKYLQRDQNVHALINMRMSDNPSNHYKKTLKMSISCGMKEADAVKIDTALNGLKVSGNVTLASEVKNEARRYLEYEIDF